MNSGHRSLLAIGLSVAVMIAWYAFFAPKTEKKPVQPTSAAQSVPAAQAEPAQKNAETETKETAATVQDNPSQDPQANLPAVESTLDNGIVRAVFTNKGAVPVKWELSAYRQTSDKNSPPLDLIPSEKGAFPSVDLSMEKANFPFPDSPTYNVVASDKDKVVYEWKSSEAKITKTISFGATKYVADVNVRVENLTSRPLMATPELTVSGASLPAKKEGWFSFLKQPPSTNKSPLYYLDGKVHREKKIEKLPAVQVIAPDPQKGGGLYWSGLEDRYFISAVIPRSVSSGVSAVMGAAALPSAGGGAYEMYAGVNMAQISVLPNSAADLAFTVYSGPKDIDDLKAVGVHLDEAIDYGWFTIIALPILYLLKIFYTVVRNYGIAIILLTIFIKLLLHPINIRSMKSMKAMQTLQPKLKELQKKYAKDRERLNLETMQLFKAHKVNPMGGCLPMILQFPIYIALYKVLWNSIELYHAPFFWFYRDLSAPDPYLITPILLGLFMVAQQKLMPSTSADPAQQKMMMIMPIMFTAFMLFLPVGLVVYILVNTVMSVTQQWMYNKGYRMRDILRLKFKPKTA